MKNLRHKGLYRVIAKTAAKDCMKSSFRAYSDVVIAIFTSAHVLLLGGEVCVGELCSQVTLFSEHHGMSFHKQNFPDVARQVQLMWPPL